MAVAAHSENIELQEDETLQTKTKEKELQKMLQSDKIRRYKRVAVGAGLLCAVLALLVIVVPLCLYVAKEQLVNRYNQLLESNNNLTEERDLLLYRNNYLNQLCIVENEQRVNSYKKVLANLTRERDQVLDSINKLTEERDCLKGMICETPGWQKFDTGCYYISTEKKTWNESRQWCRDNQSDLIVIKTQEKQDFVSSFDKRIWLGLTDRDREGSFQWVDGTPLTTPMYWKTGEPHGETNDPDNLLFSNAESDCVEYYDGSLSSHPDRGWSDAPCSFGVTYWICERVVC